MNKKYLKGGKPLVKSTGKEESKYSATGFTQQTNEESFAFFCSKNYLELEEGNHFHNLNPERFFSCDGDFFFNKNDKSFEGVIIARDLSAEQARDIIEKVTGNRPVDYSYTEDDESPYEPDSKDRYPQSYFISEDNWGYETISGRTFAYENSCLIAEGAWWFQAEVLYAKVVNALRGMVGEIVETRKQKEVEEKKEKFSDCSFGIEDLEFI